jgi:dTDP-glucose pyrophosphorylase
MVGRLKELIEAAKAVQPSQEQREEQRRSFAYGNTAFENSLITREMVDEQAELLAKEKKNGG